MTSKKDTSIWNQKSFFFFFQSAVSISCLSCLVMIHGDEIIWMAIRLCPNQISRNNTI